MAYENPRRNAAWLGRLRGRQTAVHAYDAGKAAAAARQFEHRHAAEAVATGSDAAVHVRMGCENVNRSLRALDERAAIGSQARDAGHDPLTIACDAVAVHVAGERDVAEIGEP